MAWSDKNKKKENEIPWEDIFSGVWTGLNVISVGIDLWKATRDAELRAQQGTSRAQIEYNRRNHPNRNIAARITEPESDGFPWGALALGLGAAAVGRGRGVCITSG